MKNLMFIILAFSGLCISKSYAQAPDMSKPVKEKMAVFTNWVGQWKGEGVMYRGPQASKSTVDERIETRLDGTVLLVSGLGKNIDPATNTEKVVHEAMGVLTYDAFTQQYKFKSWLRTGMSTDAWFNVVGDNKYEWGFDFPQGKIKYSITLDPAKKTWYEIGEYSADGKTWIKTFEMNLIKVD
jgi:hypothetical protein